MGIGKSFPTDFSDLLVNTATIESRAVDTDDSMGETVTWATGFGPSLATLDLDQLANLTLAQLAALPIDSLRYVDVPCSIQTLVTQGAVQQRLGEMVNTVSHVAYFNQTLAVHNGDRLTDEFNVRYQILSSGEEGGTIEEFAVYLKRIDEG